MYESISLCEECNEVACECPCKRCPQLESQLKESESKLKIALEALERIAVGTTIPMHHRLHDYEIAKEALEKLSKDA